MRKLKQDPLTLIFTISTFCWGGFHVFVSAGIDICLIILLILKTIKNKKITPVFNPVNIMTALIPFIYLLSSLWAIDKTNAVMGFVKFLPVSLTILLLSEDKDSRNNIINSIPYIAVIQTVLSAVLMQIPQIKDLFSVSGRLSGFFQYSNTFAAFITAALIIILTKDNYSVKDIIFTIILVFGLLYSGSRTAAVTAAVSVIIAIITSKNRKMQIISSLCLITITATAAVYANISGSFDTIGRFLSISVNESTFLGRLLYWKDGIRVFLSHPAGLGYMGWNFIQDSVKTGNYNVQYVHNDFLQILIDTGIIGFLLFTASIALSFFSKKTEKKTKLLIFAICAHLFMDFDLQFISYFILLAVVIYTDTGKEKEIKSVAITSLFFTATGILSIITGITDGLYFEKKYDAALKLMPSFTQAQIDIIRYEPLTDRSLYYADKIIKHNKYVSEPYEVRAAAAFSNGIIDKMAEEKLKQIELSPYNMNSYDEYCFMLYKAWEMYSEANDTTSAEFCRQKILEIPVMIENLKNKTDPIAYKTDDKTFFKLNGESQKMLDVLNNIKN